MSDRPTDEMRWAFDAGTPASHLASAAVDLVQQQGYPEDDPLPHNELNEILKRHGAATHHLLTRTYDTVAAAAADVTSSVTQDGEVCFVQGSDQAYLGEEIESSNESGTTTGEDVCCSGRHVYAYYADGELRQHDPLDFLNEVWSVSITSTIHKCACAGSVVIVTAGLRVRAYTTAGALFWETGDLPTAGTGQVTDVFVDGDWVYAVTRDGADLGEIFQLSIATGGTNRSGSLGGSLASDPIVCSDGRQIYVAFDNGSNRLQARDPEDVSLSTIWAITTTELTDAFCTDGRYLLCANASGFDQRRCMDSTLIKSVAEGLTEAAAIAMDGRYVYTSRYTDPASDARLSWWDLGPEVLVGYYEAGSNPDFGDLGADHARAICCDGNDIFTVTPVVTLSAALHQYSSGRPARLFRRSDPNDQHRAPLYTVLQPADPGV